METNEFIEDPEVLKILDCFKKIKKIHKQIKKDLTTQFEETKDWISIDFSHSYIDLYPKSKMDYIYFCNNWELFCKIKKRKKKFEIFKKHKTGDYFEEKLKTKLLKKYEDGFKSKIFDFRNNSMMIITR